MFQFCLPSVGQTTTLLLPLALPQRKIDYRISSYKRRGAYLIFVILGAALIRGRRLFRNLTILF